MSAPKSTETLNLIFLHSIHLGSPRWLSNSRYYIPSRKRSKKLVSQSLSHVQLFATPWTAAHTRLPCPSPTLGAYSNSCPSSRWCHPAISSSVIPFSSHLQSFPASGSFQMTQFFTSGGQSIRGSASASVFPMNTQDWFSFGLIGWISLQSKRLSSLLQHPSLKASILWCLAFFIVIRLSWVSLPNRAFLKADPTTAAESHWPPFALGNKGV